MKNPDTNDLSSELSLRKVLYYADSQVVALAFPSAKNPNILNPQEIILRFPKHTTDEVIKQAIRRDYPNKLEDWIVWDTSKSENIDASYDKKGNKVFDSIIYKIDWGGVYFFFLILAYPIYLLLRFVVWAICTLKKQNIEA